jgi:1,4-alpha-glucan branching enzyme
VNIVDDKRDGVAGSVGMPHKAVNFFYLAPQATSVQILGDFNRWHPVSLQPRPDGWWYVQILLAHGYHRYRFLVDGQPRLDPRAEGTARDDQQEPVSLMAVS